MKDHLIKAITKDKTFRIYCTINTNSVREIVDCHNVYHTAADAFVRFMTGSLLMGSTLKEKERLTLQISSKGPLEGLVADVNGHCEYRGYIKNPEANSFIHDRRLGVAEMIGPGYLNVVKLLLNHKEPYRGIVQLVTSEIARDLTYYLYVSEQIPSVISLGTYINRDGTVGHSGGLLVQKMPGASEEDISLMERMFDNSYSLSAYLLEGFSSEQIVLDTLKGFDIEIIDKKDVNYICGCNKDKVQNMLISIGKEEIRNLLKKDIGQTVICEFCQKVYNISYVELKSIYDKVLEESK